MITFVNSKNHSVFVNYINGTKSIRREIKPGYIVAMQGLQNIDQIKNLNALKLQGVTVYDYASNAFINTDPSYSQALIYNGTQTASGMTFNVSHYSATTAWTFTTLVNFASMALNAASASTAGNTVTIGISGTPTTQAWYNAIYATSFSAFTQINVSSASASAFVSTGTSLVRFTLSADTQATANVSDFMFVPDNAKPSDYQIITATGLQPSTSANTSGYAILASKI